MKGKPKGWRLESVKHSLARKGIKTATKKPTLIVLPNGKFRHTKWNKNPTIVGTEAPSKYKVTGKFANSSKNFKAIKTDNFSYADGINLWRGKVSELQPSGKYKTIKEVWN